MSNELRIFRFAPDAPGKGGHTTGFHTFMGREDTRRVEGFTPYRGMWKRDLTSGLHFNNTYSPRTVLGYLEWLYYTETGTSPLRKEIFVDGYYNSGSGLYIVGLRILPDGKDIYWESGGTPDLGRVPIVPVKDRVFMSTRMGPGRVWDGTVNGTTGNPEKVWKIGVPSPTVGPTVTVTYNHTSGQYYYGRERGTTIQWNSLSSDATYDGLVPGEKVRLYHESLGAPGYVERTVMERVSGYTRSATSNVGPFAFTATRVSGITCTGTNGSTTGVINHEFDDNGYGVCTDLIGLTIVCGTWERIITNATVSGGQTTITISSGWGSAVGGSFTLKGVRVYLDGEIPGDSNTLYDPNRYVTRPAPGTGYSSWSGAEAPGYAYAYYDSVSGHISNLSPITYVNATDVVNGQISIAITQNSGVNCANGDTPVSGVSSSTGIQYVGEYNSAEVARFSKILFFRTRRTGGGAVLYPIGSLDPASSKWKGINGSPGYSGGAAWVDTSTDADLVISGRVRAPLDTNYPPSYVSALGTRTVIKPYGMAWWDGRLWIFGVPDPIALHFSCDQAQAAMGRPEESFPDSNRLVIPAADGEITAILTVGEHLLVITRRYAYRILGNHESNYRLVRVSTEIGGLTAEALCEIPTDSQFGGMLAAVTTDKRILLVQLDGPTEEIGAPIVTELGGKCRGMAFYRANGHQRLAVSIEQPALNESGHVFEFNFTHKTWTKNKPLVYGNLTPNPLVEFLTVNIRNGVDIGYSGQKESYLIYGSEGDLYWWGQTSVYASLECQISTWPVPAAITKRRYAFAWARVVLVGTGVDSITAPYFYVNRDGRSADVRYSMERHATDRPERSFYSGTASLDGTAAEWVCFGPKWNRFNNAAITNDGTLPVGYQLEFQFVPNGADDKPYSVAFIEVAVREWTEDGDVEP